MGDACRVILRRLLAAHPQRIVRVEIQDPVILDIPAFDSKYVSLMTFTYDHYINVPLPARPPEFRSDG